MNYRTQYETEVRKRLGQNPEPQVMTPGDIQHLPEPVQKYLVYVNAVGNPGLENVRVVFNGSMKRNRKSGWMSIRSEQFNFFDEPLARFFYIRAKLFGIPFDGLHLYLDHKATMQIKIASMFQVVDAKGEMMDRGETVTLLNDICFMAPSALVSKNIQWETIGPLTVRATLTTGKITVSAILSFNEAGELINFISNDRYYCEDGKTYLEYPWSTPISNYVEIKGRKVPSYGEAIWHMPEGAFCYARFDLAEISYNCTEFI
ncbi:MAG: DUF6544 family protein [Bacteroidales bacterium]